MSRIGDLLTMWDLIQWLQAQSDQNVLATLNQNASNIVLFSYLVGFAINRKRSIVAVFLFSEFLGLSKLLDTLTDITFYAIHAIIYLCLYWYLVRDKTTKTLQLLSCLTIALLSIGMIIDAIAYASVETVFYQAYELWFVGLHCLFILSFISLRKIRNNARNFISSRPKFLGVNNDASLNRTSNKKV